MHCRVVASNLLHCRVVGSSLLCCRVVGSSVWGSIVLLLLNVCNCNCVYNATTIYPVTVYTIHVLHVLIYVHAVAHVCCGNPCSMEQYGLYGTTVSPLHHHHMKAPLSPQYESTGHHHNITAIDHSSPKHHSPKHCAPKHHHSLAWLGIVGWGKQHNGFEVPWNTHMTHN